MFGRRAKPDMRNPDLSELTDAGLEASRALKRLAENPTGPIDAQTAADLAAVVTLTSVTLAEMANVLAVVQARLEAAGS
jgi:hypothetical protein